MSVEIIRLGDAPPLPPNVVIGDGSRLEVRRGTFDRFTTQRHPGLTLGERVDMFCWTSFGTLGDSVISVGDDSVLVGAQIICAERVEIGKRVVVSYNVLIVDSDFHPRDAESRRRDAIGIAPGGSGVRPPIASNPVVIEDDVWIGIGAIVLKGVRIGAGARIGPGAVVTSDVRAGAAFGFEEVAP